MNTENKRQRGNFDDYEEYQPVEQTTEENTEKQQPDQTDDVVSKISGMSTDIKISEITPVPITPRFSRPIKRDTPYKQPQQQTQNVKPLYLSVTKLNDMIEAFHGRMFINAVVVTSGRFVGQYTVNSLINNVYVVHANKVKIELDLKKLFNGAKAYLTLKPSGSKFQMFNEKANKFEVIIGDKKAFMNKEGIEIIYCEFNVKALTK